MRVMRESSDDDMLSSRMMMRMRGSMRDAMPSRVIREPLPQCPYRRKYFLRTPFEIQKCRIKTH